ncbi:MAG: hypothetical protein OEZ01_15555 [Candidatus Heimdallarchaeota archaeon]|nr:hypothetical protein [Candidatus Heimdallarchaeota archaeon]MDH5647425.1 hypothetical protein [Candidatus Heimdallarchaeota archaeon]
MNIDEYMKLVEKKDQISFDLKNLQEKLVSDITTSYCASNPNDVLERILLEKKQEVELKQDLTEIMNLLSKYDTSSFKSSE